MPSYSRSRLLIGLLAVTVVAACARRAPDLPADYGSVSAERRLTAQDFRDADLQRTCSDIDTELAILDTKMNELDDGIRAKSGSNQAAGYVAGVIFPPAILATDNSAEAKLSLDEHQARAGRLVGSVAEPIEVLQRPTRQQRRREVQPTQLQLADRELGHVQQVQLTRSVAGHHRQKRAGGEGQQHAHRLFP